MTEEKIYMNVKQFKELVKNLPDKDTYDNDMVVEFCLLSEIEDINKQQPIYTDGSVDICIVRAEENDDPLLMEDFIAIAVKRYNHTKNES